MGRSALSGPRSQCSERPRDQRCNHPGGGRGREYPDALRRIWSMGGSSIELSAQKWAEYDTAGAEIQLFRRGDGSRFHERRQRLQRDCRRSAQMPGALAGCANSRSCRRLVDATTAFTRCGARRHGSRHGAAPRTDRRRGAGPRRGSGPRAPITSSYIWKDRQQRARRQCGYARYILLKPILVDARMGTLDPNWCQGLSTTLIGGGLDTSLEDSNHPAIPSLSTMGVQQWERYIRISRNSRSADASLRGTVAAVAGR